MAMSAVSSSGRGRRKAVGSDFSFRLELENRNDEVHDPLSADFHTGLPRWEAHCGLNDFAAADRASDQEALEGLFQLILDAEAEFLYLSNESHEAFHELVLLVLEEFMPSPRKPDTLAKPQKLHSCRVNC